jgi:cathepsin L
MFPTTKKSKYNLLTAKIICNTSSCQKLRRNFHPFQANGGIDTEDSYPYEGRRGACRFSRSKVGGVASGFVSLPRLNEFKLMEAVATVGPVSVAVDASLQSFAYYGHGIYKDNRCSKTNLNHAVLV